MPDHLYRPDPQLGLIFVGYPGSYYALGDNRALETMYRIDVGGASPISPAWDTGMFRNWGVEEAYLMEPRWSTVASLKPSVSLNFLNSTPPYTAPEDVCRTTRTLVNKRYNLTWEFSVDTGFDYMVRLHFCGIEADVTQENEAVFTILISNHTADSEAVVLLWSGGIYIPYVRDYVVSIFGNN